MIAIRNRYTRIMGKTKLIRICTWLYPFFLIGLCLWGWLSYRRLEPRREELEKLTEETEELIAQRAMEWGSPEDLSQLRDVKDRWLSKTGLRAMDVPVLLEDAARSAGCRLTDYTATDPLTDGGYRYQSGELNVVGSFPQVLIFLTALERHPERFVRVPSVRIQPDREDGKLSVRLRVEVLLEKADQAQNNGQ